MSRTSIEDPFQLASYTSSSRWKGKKSTLDHVYTSQLNSTSSKSHKEGYVTVATQADGIHIVDVSTQHPLASYTLGPSTSFSCPAISIESSADQYTTYAVIESSSELASQDEAGRVIWKWDQPSGSVSSISESLKKTSRIVVSSTERIHSLHADAALPRRVLAVTSVGRAIVLDSDTLEEKAVVAAPKTGAEVIEAFVHPTSAPGTIAVAVAVSTSSSLQLRVTLVDETDTTCNAGDYEFPHKAEHVSALSYSQSGYFTVLCKDGEWLAYALPEPSSASAQKTTPRPSHAPLKLSNLNFSSTSKKQAPANSPPSITALTSSHVLLAATSPSSTDIHLQIWDLHYSIILAEHTLPIPSAFSSSPLQLRLVSGGRKVPASASALTQVHGQALLALSPATGTKHGANENITSTVLIVPYSVSYQSTIASAMCRAAATKQWLKPAVDAASSSQSASPAENSRANVLKAVRLALEEGKPKVAETAFSTWLTEAEATAKAAIQEKAHKNEKASAAPRVPIFVHAFVKDLVGDLLPPLKLNGNPPYAHSAEILRTLMQRKLVSNGMVEGGLLNALRARKDWASVELAFSTVQDLPTNDVIQCLATVVRHHRQSPSPSEDAMQVDSAPAPSAPSVPVFLGLVINYITLVSPSQIIIALKRHLRDPEDVQVVAKTLAQWSRTLHHQRQAQDLQVWPSNKDMEQNEHGIWVYSLQNREKRSIKAAAKKAGGPPVFERLVTFLQPFLDACFLPLLQHAPSHSLLRDLRNDLIEESRLSELLLQLQGPLELFNVSHQKFVKEASIPEKEKQNLKQKGDWRQRRAGTAAVVGAVGTVGVYQLEELAF